MAAGQLEVGQQLGFMDWSDPIDRFELDDDLAIDEQVESIAAVDEDIFVDDGQRRLSLKIQPALGELLHQASFIG